MVDQEIMNADLASVLPKDVKWNTPHVLKLNLRIFVLLLSAVCMGFDSGLMNALQSLETWHDYFDHPSPALLGTVNVVLNIAPLVGGWPIVWASDRFGRSKVLLVGCVWLILSAGLQAGSPNLATFAASRFLIGIGIEMCVVTALVLINELASAQYRSKLSALFFTFFFVGAIISSWTVYGTARMRDQSTWTWRLPSLLQGIIPTIQLIFWYWIPESPRWLISKGRDAEAESILSIFHADNDANSPIVRYEMAQMRQHISDESRASQLVWSDVWKSPADKKRFALVLYIALMSQMGGSALISYYLVLILQTIGITDPDTQTLINGILSIWNWLVACSGALSVDRLGRRFLWLTAIGGMLVSFCVWTGLSAAFEHSRSSHIGTAVLAMIFIFNGFYAFGVTPLSFSYNVEILPFHARQKGVGVSYMMNSVALIFNNQVNPIALDKIGWRYYLVPIALLAKWLVVAFLFFPETRGQSLEDLSTLFDGPAMGLRKATGKNSVTSVQSTDSCLGDDSVEKVKPVVFHKE